MQFFTPLQIKKAMFGHRDRMEALGKMLDDCLPGSSISGDFRAACGQQDSEILNDVLTQAVISLLGNDDVMSGLEDYCQKCGVSVSLRGMSDMNKVRRVAEHRADILSRLDHVQQTSAGAARSDNQLSGDGNTSDTASPSRIVMGLLAVAALMVTCFGLSSGSITGIIIGILIAALIVAFYFRKQSANGSGKKNGSKAAGHVFTKNDRALINLLCVIVDIIDSMEK